LRRRRSTGSARWAVPLLVVLVSVAGFVVTTRAVDDERGNVAQRRADVEALGVQGQLDRARAFAIGLANALEGERAPDGRRFAALEGSATATVGLTAAMWVERVPQRARRDYERRIGAPITQPPGSSVAGPASTYLPATFVTGVAVHPGADMARVPTLAGTLRDPTSIFAGTATAVATLAGQRGFFVVQGARFGHGAGSQGFLVVFAPADWLSVSQNLDAHRTAISLDGRPLNGALAGAPAAGRSFESLTRRWRVDVTREPQTALQATLPWLAVSWPPATALLVYLLGRGMLRRRRAERQVDDIFDLSPDLLCVTGFDGYFKRVNPAFEHTLGYDAVELLSRPVLDFVHPDDRKRTAEMVGALSEGQHSSDFENRFVRADGALRWLQWNTRAMPEKGLMYAAARDVTENRTLTEELAASRGRIVATADEARRRIERDLHDGAQARLVSTVLALKLARTQLGDADGPAAELVEEALMNAERGIDEIRELARGIHPRILSAGGLGPALRTLARRAPLPVTVDMQSDARLPETVEVTAYFVASEALANAAKHARASEVSITVEADDRRIVLSVRDDGIGGADPSLGSGLIGLHDRVAAAGGVLAVESRRGAGTAVTARIPVAATAAGADA
jgi:PAS domain S-box-containing protein